MQTIYDNWRQLCDSMPEPVIDLNMLELITRLYVIKQHTILMLFTSIINFFAVTMPMHG